MNWQKFIPNLHVESIYEIDLDALRQVGISGLITDLDNTLIEWDNPQTSDELMEWVRKLKNQGFQVVIVSNNRNAKRVAFFAEKLGVYYISRAKKPTLTAFTRALDLLGLQPGQAVMVGDQLLTDIFGGNRAGMHTILVKPMKDTDSFFTRFNRAAERIVIRALRKRGLMNWED